MVSRINRRRFLEVLGLITAGTLIGCGPRKAVPDLPAEPDAAIGMPEAATLPLAFHGADLTGWDVHLGEMVYQVEGQSEVTASDIGTLHQGTHSELQANVTRRGIMAHNVTSKRVIDAQAVSCVQTVSFVFRLPYAPARQNADVNGQAFRVGLYGWDNAAGLQKGLGLQWMLDPRLPIYGALATWTSEGTWVQIGRLEPDTNWHIVQLAVSFPQSLASFQIDGQSYPARFASWRSSVSGAVIGARLQVEAISQYPGPDQQGTLWAVQVRDWRWTWEQPSNENQIFIPAVQGI